MTEQMFYAWMRTRQKTGPVTGQAGSGKVASTPQQDTVLEDLGSKTISELVDSDIVMSWKEGTATVTGTIHNITDPWTEFQQNDNNTGHFFPIQFDKSCAGKTCTAKNRTNADRTTTLDDDCLVIARLENFKDNKIVLEIQDDKTYTFDFSQANLES